MATGISDIQYAMKGEQPVVAPKEPDYVPEAAPIRDDTPKDDGFVVYKLVKNKDGGTYIPNVDYVIDPRTITKEKPNGDGPEMIRLLNGVNTIWAKEQEKLDKEFIKRNGRFIEFPKGTKFKSIPTWDKTAIEFMDVCRHNIGNPNRKTGSKFEFFKYDPQEVAKERYKKELLEVQMTVKANEQPYEKMQKHAFYLGISLTNELGGVKKEGELRVDYMLSAKRDPVNFQKSFDSREVDILFKVRAAILDAKIDIGRGDGKIYWGNGGGLICAMPSNPTDVARYLTKLALTPEDDGKRFLQQLNEIIT